MAGAPWRQVRDDLIAGITDGRWPPGTRIPSHWDLAVEHHCSISPVRRAIADLQAAGVLRGEQGAGVWVISEPVETPSLEDRMAALEARVAALEAG